MQITITRSILIILIAAAATVITRAIPFLLFRGKEEPPQVIVYLGKVLPPAVIGMLVVFCLRNIEFAGSSHGIPELAAAAVVVGLHKWKRNMLLSIGTGTILYMVLIRII